MRDREINTAEDPDPKIRELFEEGKEVYRQLEDLDEVVINYDNTEGVDHKIYVNTRDLDNFAENALSGLAEHRSFFPPGTKLNYSPKERVLAFLSGFGFEATYHNDWRTALLVLSTLLEDDSKSQTILKSQILSILNKEN